jgi:hypothetical protein
LYGRKIKQLLLTQAEVLGYLLCGISIDKTEAMVIVTTKSEPFTIIEAADR